MGRSRWRGSSHKRGIDSLKSDGEGRTDRQSAYSGEVSRHNSVANRAWVVTLLPSDFVIVEGTVWIVRRHFIGIKRIVSPAWWCQRVPTVRCLSGNNESTLRRYSPWLDIAT